MKHEGLHLSNFPQSFALKGVNHFAKSLHIWQLVMIHVTGNLMQCALNTINLNK
jgi:hypothetical protein